MWYPAVNQIKFACRVSQCLCNFVSIVKYRWDVEIHGRGFKLCMEGR